MRAAFSSLFPFLRDKSDPSVRFEQLGPWITKFKINGIEYGGWYNAADDARVQLFQQHLPSVESILEMGCLEAGHTIRLSRLPGVEKVVALEGRDHNLAKARFVESLLGNGKAQYLLADLDKDDLAQYGRFDAVFSVGLLYHLTEPWLHLKKTRTVSENIFLWTHYVREDKADVMQEGYLGSLVQEKGFLDPLSGLSPRSFWPTLESLKLMLRDAGYEEIVILDKQEGHPDGPGVNLVARG